MPVSRDTAAVTSVGSTGRRSRVRWGGFGTAAGQFTVADGADRDPPSPPSRVVGGPLRDVQIERSDVAQVLDRRQSWSMTLDDLTVLDRRRRLHLHPQLPCCGDLGRQMQGGDARAMQLSSRMAPMLWQTCSPA